MDVPLKFLKSILILCAILIAIAPVLRADPISVSCTITDITNPCLQGFSSTSSIDWSITNSSGVTWTDYEITADAGSWNPSVYTGPGTATFPTASTFEIVGLNVPNGATLTFSNQWVYACNNASGFCPGYFTYGTPSIGENGGGGGGGGTAVPEPASILLLGSGLLGAMGIRRMKATT